MLIDLYLLLYCLGFLFFILSFVREEKYVFATISFFLFFFLAFSSFNIEINYCGLNSTDEYSCHTENFNDTSVVMFNVGLAIVSLLYLIIYSMMSFSKQPKKI